MRLRHILQSRLRSLFFRDRRESDLREELQFHLERETERLQASGLSRDAARLHARRLFGGVEPIKDACRDARGTALFDNVVRDVRYAGRSFRRAPLAALTIITTVGLGLGLVTVAFTLLNAFIFRVDEVRNPHELFAVERQRSANTGPEAFTRAQYEALVRETGVFSDAFARTPEIDSWIEGRRMEGPLVTGNFFQILGVSAARGRTLTPADDEPGGRPVIVLSHRAWSRHFAGDPGVLNRTVLLNGAQFHVVGVMAEGFRGLTPVSPDYWAARTSLIMRVHGDSERARHALVGRLAAIDPNMGEVSTLRTIARIEAYLLGIPFWLTLVLGALALLLTLSGLFSVLSYLVEQRTREIGVRMALGATRQSIGALVLSQSARPVGIGLLLGSSLTAALGAALLATPLAAEIGSAVRLFDPVAYAASLLCIVTACACAALIPALRAGRIDPVTALRQD